MEFNKPLTWILVFVVVIIGVIICIVSAKFGTNSINIITTLGTYISLVAFIVMLQQFRSVKNTTENVKQEVGKIAAIADLSKYLERIITVIDDIHTGEFRLAAFKLESVQDALVSVKSKMTNEESIKRYKTAISKVSTTKNTLQEKDVCLENLNLVQIKKDMEAVVAFLQEEKYKMVK